MRRVERPDLRIRGTYGAPSAITGYARLVLKKFEIIGNLRAILPVSNTMRRTRRFRQLAGDRLRSRLRLALANHHALAVENANMRLVH
jgi:hypothetical protein